MTPKLGDRLGCIEPAVKPIAGTPSPDVPQLTLDRAMLLARVEGDVALLGAMAAMFLEGCNEHLRALRHAVDSHDPRALESSAHALKGSVSNFMAHDATQAALRLELMGRHEDLTHAEPALADLEVALERLRPSLEELKACRST